MNTTFKLFAALFFVTFSLRAQEDKVLIPTPESASLIKWSENDVDFSSGSVNTYIPLYNLKDGNLEVPVGLHYNGSSGIRVEEAAGITGLGWDLVAGGRIVRVVRDKPDESYTINPIQNEKGGIDAFEIGYKPIPLGENFATAKASVEWNRDKYIYRGGWFIMGDPIGMPDFESNDPALFDLQPDLYIVNVGKDIVQFTFDRYRNPVIINNKDYKIEILWQNYNPGFFLTTQKWNLNVDVDFTEFIQKKKKDASGQGSNLIPTTLGITVGLDQFKNDNSGNLDVIGFRGFKITAIDGTMYYFGGSKEYMEFNYNDQAYLNSTDRLTIAINNLSQKLPVSWALQKIESPFGEVNSKNTIEFTYKRTSFYEPFNTTDNQVNAAHNCDFPRPKADKFNKDLSSGFNFSNDIKALEIITDTASFLQNLTKEALNHKLDSLKDIGQIVSTITGGILNFSYTPFSEESLNAYVTLESRVILGLYPDKIISPNFEIEFNSVDLMNLNLDLAEFENVIPGFNEDSFSDLERKDIQPEGSLSSEEEKRKEFYEYNEIDQSMTLNFGDLSIQTPNLISVGVYAKNGSSGKKGDFLKNIKSLYPKISYTGDAVQAGLNGGGAYFNWSGRIFKVDAAGEFSEIAIPNPPLKNISVKDKSTGKSKGFYFDYDYFKTYMAEGVDRSKLVPDYAKQAFLNVEEGGVISDLPADYYPALHERYGIYEQYDRERLRLKGVYELKIGQSTVGILPGTTFDYNQMPMPRRLSMAQDYWGYYNGQHDNRNKSLLVSRPKYSNYDSNYNATGTDGAPACLNASDLRPDPVFAQAGVLNSIKFPTGARKIFKYELNAAYDYFGKVGGLRVKEIESFEPVKNANYFSKYSYLDDRGQSSGVLSIIPDYVFNHVKGNTQSRPVILPNYISLLNSYFTNGSPISYTKVTQYDSSAAGLNGRTEYYFNNLSSASKRKDPILEENPPRFIPRNIYNDISFSTGVQPNAGNTIIDIDTSRIGVQKVFYADNEGMWTLDSVSGDLSFEPYDVFITDPQQYPKQLTFEYRQVEYSQIYKKKVGAIPYNYGGGGKIIGYETHNSYQRLGNTPYYDYSKNTLQKVLVYNKSNQLVNSTEFTYSNINDYANITATYIGANFVSSYPVTKLSVGLSIGLFFVPSFPFVMPELGVALRDITKKSGEYYPYSVGIRRYDLLTKKQTNFDVNGENPLTTIEEYKYSFNHHSPIQVMTIDSKRDTIVNYIKFAFDQDLLSTDTLEFASLPQLDEPGKIAKDFLLDLKKSYINFPFEEYTTVNSKVVSGKFFQLDTNSITFHGAGLPKVEYVLELDKPLAKNQFKPLELWSYHRRVNNSQQNGFEDQYYDRFIMDSHYVPRLYISEYNSKGLPVRYNKSADVETKVIYGYNNLIPVSKTVGLGTPLERTTNYEYIPLYGVTRETPPNGLTVNYEYDEIGRLIAIKNHKGELIKSYQYHYQGEQ